MITFYALLFWAHKLEFGTHWLLCYQGRGTNLRGATLAYNFYMGFAHSTVVSRIITRAPLKNMT